MLTLLSILDLPKYPVDCCVSGYGGEQLALLEKEKEEQKGGEWGQYISFYRPPLGPSLGQQNLDRRRFDLLGNKETPTNVFPTWNQHAMTTSIRFK